MRQKQCHLPLLLSSLMLSLLKPAGEPPTVELDRSWDTIPNSGTPLFPISEIANVYPAWLEENKETLSEEDYVRFEKQYIIISEVCRDFEEETETSSEDEKQRRFERVLLHMQNMHALGQPPKELLLKLDPTMETNPGGVPLMPQMDQCNVM